MAVCQNLVPLVNIKIAGKWMFIPLKMVLIGIDPYPNHHFQWELLANLEFQPLPCLREGTIGIHRSHRYYSYLGTAKFEPFDHFFSKQIINPGCPIAEWPNVKGSQRRRIPAHHRIWAEGMRVAA